MSAYTPLDPSDRRWRRAPIALVACTALAAAFLVTRGGLRPSSAMDAAELSTPAPSYSPTKSCRGDCNEKREEEREERKEEKTHKPTPTSTYAPSAPTPRPSSGSNFEDARAPVPTLHLPTHKPTNPFPTPSPSPKPVMKRKSSNLAHDDGDDTAVDDTPYTAARGAASDDDDDRA